MATALQEVDPDDLSTVLFDYNDNTGANNLGTVQTWMGVGGVFSLGGPAVSIDSSNRLGDGAQDVRFSYDQIVQSSFRMRASATTYDNLRQGIGVLQRLLGADGVMRWVPHGSANTYYIYRKPSNIPALFSGADIELYERLKLFDSPQGLEIVVNRERLLRGPLLLGMRNRLSNGTLLRASGGLSSAPDSFAWGSTSNITTAGWGANMNWPTESYRFTIATSATRSLQQSTGLATASPGQVWTFAFDVRASGGTLAKAVAVLEFMDASSAVLATASGTLTTLVNGADFVRLSVTSSAAPALTDHIRVNLRMTNGDATAYTVDFRRAQLENAPNASTFRVGQEPATNDAGLVTGKFVLVYNPGDANALARVTLKPTSGADTVAWNLGRRSEGLDTNLAETVNYFGPGANFRTMANISLQTLYGGTSGDTSSAADSGTSTSTNAAKTTFANFPSLVRRWRWRSTPTDPYALHGRWDVYAAVRGEAGNAYRVCMHWQAANRDPVTETEDEIIYDCTDLTSSIYTPLLLGQVQFNALEGDTDLVIEGWAALDSGSGNLWWDVVYLLPADEQQTLLQVPGFRRGSQAVEEWLGSELDLQPAGCIAGSGSTATFIPTGSTKAVMQEQYEGVGTPPGSATTGGVVWAQGRHVVAATCILAEPDGTPPSPSFGKLRIRKAPGPGHSVQTWAATTAYSVGDFVKPTNANRAGRTFLVTNAGTTGGTEPGWNNSDGVNSSSGGVVFTETTVASVTLNSKNNYTQTRKTWRVSHDADGSTAYEGVVVFTAGSGTAGRRIHVLTLRHRILRVVDDGYSAKMLGDTETLGTYNGNTSIDPMVKSGPFLTLGPGLNVIWVDLWSKAAVAYDDVDPRDPLAKHDPTRTTTVTVDVIPRYWS